jgi:Putative endonuclease segE, GIY-YIG domain
MPSWMYKGKPFTDPRKWIGFVYLISNLKSGKLYIGKKLFTKAGYKQVKKKRKKLRVESNWLEYFGSNIELQEDVAKQGKQDFKREILRLCKFRSECTYYETKAIFDADALLDLKYYNYWVSCKITRAHTNSWNKPPLRKKKI